MAKKKAIIFDMDGVLIDSEALWKQAENEVFTSLGVEVTEKYTEMTKSMTTSEATKFWFDKFPWKNFDLETVEQMVISKVIDLIKSENCEIEGVKHFIEKLKDNNFKIGLVTNSPNRIIPTVLQKLAISHLFDSISSAEFEQKGKPHPAIYFTSSKKLNTEPANCLAIEDSHSGMLAAKNAGMKVIAFTNGNKEKDFHLADYKIVSFKNREIAFLE